MTQLEILQAARLGYEGKLAEVDRMIAAIKVTDVPVARVPRIGRPPKLKPVPELAATPRKKRKMSVAGRKRIAEATRKRWAAFHAAKRNAA